MLALSFQRPRFKSTSRGVRPLIEDIGLSPHREIRLRIALEVLAQGLPSKVLARRLEGEGGKLDLGPDLEPGACLVPDVRNSPHQIAWLRVQSAVLQPAMKLMEEVIGNVVRKNPLDGAPVGKAVFPPDSR